MQGKNLKNWLHFSYTLVEGTTDIQFFSILKLFGYRWNNLTLLDILQIPLSV